METAERPVSSRRTRPQQALIALNCILIVGCLVMVGGLGYFAQRVGNIPRIDIGAGVLGSRPGDDSLPDPGGPQNYLLVGSDTREGQDEGFGTTAETGDARADTMMLVRIDPGQERAAIVSFPRDLWVDIYDEGGNRQGVQRINTAFAGGPEQLISTIRHNFDIPVHHYAQVNFAGFHDLVEAVGGVQIYLPGPVRDRDASGNNLAGLDLPEGGCVTLDGAQALAYVRSRHFQQYVDGRWQADPYGDLGRIERQQDFIRRAVREALSRGLTNPVKINQLLGVAEDNIVVDRTLDGSDIVNIGRRFQTLTPDTLDQRSLVVVDRVTAAGAQVLELADDPANEETFAIFRGEDPEEPAGPEDVVPGSVQLRVLNGTGRTGEAGVARDGLTAAGFGVQGVGDGTVGAPATLVRYGLGQRAKAELVVRWLDAPGAELVEDDSLTVDVVVVTGADFAGVRDEPGAPAAAPPPADDPAPEPEAPAEEPVAEPEPEC
jgi:polyisoprenyl-teichoic acid--peptidoglycan teichoic acid transferase